MSSPCALEDRVRVVVCDRRDRRHRLIVVGVQILGIDQGEILLDRRDDILGLEQVNGAAKVLTDIGCAGAHRLISPDSGLERRRGGRPAAPA